MMMIRNNSIYTLSLARRAGKLTVGFTASKQAVLQNKAVAVVITKDASERTRRNILLIAGKIPCMDIPFTQNDIESVMKRKFAVAAILSTDFLKLFLKALEEDMDVN